MERNALERSAIEAIIQAQASRTQRRAAADIVVYNDRIGLEALKTQVVSLARRFGL